MDVQFVDTTFRDGAQSLWASGIRTGMIEAVAESMDDAGFHAVEVPVNGNFVKKFVRNSKEDPFAMARMLARKMPNAVKTTMGVPTFWRSSRRRPDRWSSSFIRIW